MSTSHKLTNLQLELIKLFNYELPEEQLTEIKEVLAKYFANKASDAMDVLWDEKKLSDETMELWRQEDLRTPYE